MKKILPPFILCFVLLGVLHAQTPSAGPPVEDQVSLQFRILAWHGDVGVLGYGRNQKVDATEMTSYSEAHNYTGPVTLTFTPYPRKKDDRKQDPVLASVLLPKDARRVTLLTVPAGRGHYGMYVIPEDDTGLPARHVRLHNLTTYRLLIRFNANERVELAPATSVLVTAPGKGLVIRVARIVNGQWRELFNNVVALDNAGGGNVLLITGAEGAGIGMFTQPGWPKATVPATVAASPSMPSP